MMDSQKQREQAKDSGKAQVSTGLTFSKQADTGKRGRSTQASSSEPVEATVQPESTYYVKCVYHTRVVVEAGVPSGSRYDFQPGEVKPVKAEDRQFLLDKKRETSAGCCGSTDTVIPYFEEA